jgi:hypothetical protein
MKNVTTHHRNFCRPFDFTLFAIAFGVPRSCFGIFYRNSLWNNNTATTKLNVCEMIREETNLKHAKKSSRFVKFAENNEFKKYDEDN